MTWSATALRGAVTTIIMILSTLAEFSYPHNWNNTLHLTRRLVFLIITFGLTSGPTFYIAIVEHNSNGGFLSLILGVVHLGHHHVPIRSYAFRPNV